MVIRVTVSTVYECSLERAFKTPMLCDLAKVHTGFAIMPRVTRTTHSKGWGLPGSSKEVHTAKSLFTKRGFAFVDKVLERIENRYWKIQVDDFQFWMGGFRKFVGEWKTVPVRENRTLVRYSYSLHTGSPLLYPAQWLFARFFWKAYMKQVLRNVEKMVLDSEPYLYE